MCYHCLSALACPLCPHSRLVSRHWCVQHSASSTSPWEALGVWLLLCCSSAFLGSMGNIHVYWHIPFPPWYPPCNFCSTAFYHVELKGLWGPADFGDLACVLGSLKLVGLSVAYLIFPRWTGAKIGLYMELLCSGQLITPISLSLPSTYGISTRFSWADSASDNLPKCIYCLGYNFMLWFLHLHHR